MDETVLDEVTGWEARPVADGYAGLQTLADEEFTGAVEAGRTYAFLLNGRVVGVVDGAIESFEGATLSAYAAPDESLPLLFAMQEGDSEERARYFSDDTPLSEADATLSSGQFTGYVELSENVLSGDYYVVYYGGRSLPVAFVGNNRRLVTGDEAFELADDEVGIYQVRDATVDVVDVPDQGGGGGDGAAGGRGGVAASPGDGESPPGRDRDRPAGGRRETDRDAGNVPTDAAGDADSSDDGIDEGVPPTEEHAGGRDQEPATDPYPGPGAGVEASDDAGQERPDIDLEGSLGGEGASPDESGATDPTPGDAGESSTDSTEASVEHDWDDYGAESDVDEGAAGETGAAPPMPDSEFDPEAGAEPDPDDGPAGHGDDPASTDGPGTSGVDSAPERPPAGGDSHDGHEGEADPDATGGGDPFSAEERWREERVIPALDPDDTGTDGDAVTVSEERADGADTADLTDQEGDGPAVGEPPADVDESTSEESSQAERRPGRVEELEVELAEAVERQRQLADERAELERERDEAVERAEELSRQVEDLQAEIRRLEEELAEARASEAAADAAVQVSPADALAGAHLFVRYESTGGATLSSALEGAADREAVTENLRVEHHHTQFDAGEAAVDGEPFDDFLEGTVRYQFVEWIVSELLFEVVETGNAEGLDRLVQAIPESDRAELDGAVTVPADESGDAEHRSLRFDVVVRDRMGNPLVVADLNESRDAATDEQMADLVEKAEAVGRAKEEFAAAFLVTSSFFDPAALERADAATDSGGFLGGSKRRSYVKLSRRNGFHLCLVETRGGSFHVNVPEL